MKDIRKYFEDLLHRELEEYPRFARLFIHQFRLLVYIWKQLVRDDCLGRASALAYVTLLAIIPVITISFSTYKAFGGLEQVENNVKTAVLNWLLATKQIDTKHPGQEGEKPEGEEQPQVLLENYAENIAGWINTLSNRLSSAKVNIISLVWLILISVFLLNTIEGAFNRIWHVTKGRSLVQKFAIFWAVITLLPVLLGASFFLTGRVHDWMERLPQLNIVSKVVFRMLPILATCVAFFLLYMLVPNARVRWRSALAGAIVAGVLWEFAKMGFSLYIKKVIFMYSMTYGSLGLIPIFLVWLFLTWLIVLFGVEVTYTSQNIHALRYEDRRAKRGMAPWDTLAARMVLSITKRFLHGKPPLSIGTLAQELGLTEDEVRPIAEKLVHEGILIATNGPDLQYIPARSAANLTIGDVIAAVKPEPALGFLTAGTTEEERIKKVFEEIHIREMEISGKVTFKDIIEKEAGDSPPKSESKD